MSDEVLDAAGRVISVQRLPKLQMRKLIRAWGAASDIDRWVGEAIVAAHATAIDGVPLPLPTSADTADANISKLDNHGIQAIGEWLQTLPTQAEVVAAAKN